MDLNIGDVVRALEGAEVPVEHVYALRNAVAAIQGENDPLCQFLGDHVGDGSEVADAELADALGGETIGAWAMGRLSMDVWCDLIRRLRPVTVLEFGSGISTLASAMLMKQLHGDDRPRVFTVEQEEVAWGESLARLQRAGLDNMVRVCLAPLANIRADAFDGAGYDFSRSPLSTLLGDEKPGLVLVDGPAGPHGARFSTLLEAHPYLAPGAVVMVDDALRDSEITTLRWWGHLGYLETGRIWWHGKGLALGVRGERPQRYVTKDESGALKVQGRDSVKLALLRLAHQREYDTPFAINPPFQISSDVLP